jgi:TFIIF-interacting CTD phosphatase-like protein
MLIILDIDNTLVCTYGMWFQIAPEFSFKLYGYTYNVYLRPKLYDFLDFLFNNFDVAFWTAATRSYANCILKRILNKEQKKKTKFLYSRLQCNVWKNFYVKNLKLINEPCILIDDDENHWIYNRIIGLDNIIYRCRPFYGLKHDHEFKLIMMWLRHMYLIKQSWKRKPSQKIKIKV